MASIDEQILRTAKEIVVKFIETGRVSPVGFSEAFHSIYTTVDATVKEALDSAEVAEAGPDRPEELKKKGRKEKKSEK